LNQRTNINLMYQPCVQSSYIVHEFHTFWLNSFREKKCGALLSEQPSYIVLLVFCLSWRKKCKNWWPGISGMSLWGMSCISIPICLPTREVHRNCKAPCDYTYTGRSRKQGNYNGVFLDNEGPSDSISRDITKTTKWHGLWDPLAMDLLHVGWQKNYSHIDRSKTGGVCHKLMSIEAQFITP